jgi:hypothetical protein
MWSEFVFCEWTNVCEMCWIFVYTYVLTGYEFDTQAHAEKWLRWTFLTGDQLVWRIILETLQISFHE